MFGKSYSAAFALAAVLAETLGYAAASPLLAYRTNSQPPAPKALVLQPASIPKTPGNDSCNNLHLSSQDNFYWAHPTNGVLANLHIKAGSGFRLLNSHQFKDLVSSVDCSNDDITIKFTDTATMKAAEGAWDWVNLKAANKAVYIVDGNGCGGKHGRQPFIVNSIKYDASCDKAILEAQATQWDSFVQDATMRIHGAPAGSTKRGLSKSVTINTAHEFSGPIFQTTVDGIKVAVACTECKTTGAINADISISFFSGIQASLTTENDFGVTVGIDLSATGSITKPIVSQSVRLATIPLSGISIGGVLELGPQLTFDAAASISGLTANIDTKFGLCMTLPDGSSVSIGKKSAALQPKFEKLPTSIKAAVSVTAKVSPVVTFDLAATLLGRGFSAGIALQAPVLSATVKGVAGLGSAACGNSTQAVAFELDVGMEVDVFGGLGSAQSTPNKIPIFTKSQPIFTDCLLTN